MKAHRVIFVMLALILMWGCAGGGASGGGQSSGTSGVNDVEALAKTNSAPGAVDYAASAGVLIEVVGAGAGLTCTTGADGKCKIPGVPPGTWTLKASKSGYNDATQSLTWDPAPKITHHGFSPLLNKKP